MSNKCSILVGMGSQPRDLRYGVVGAPADWQHQEVTNAEWPPPGVARLLQEQTPVSVNARIVWQTDGEEWVTGSATRWLRPVVFVRFSDPRLSGAGVWLPAADIRRTVIGAVNDPMT